MTEDTSAHRQPVLLIVERKLIRNRGHQHTQVAALRDLYPEHKIELLTGEGYDGFLGEAFARIRDTDLEAAKLYWRLANGTLRQKADAALRAAVAGRFWRLPRSPYGQTLRQPCGTGKLTDADTMIIPSADLEALESVCELSGASGLATPKIVLRFLDPQLGEHKHTRRAARIAALAEELAKPNRIELFCETEEMAAYLTSTYGLETKGGFYLPCSFDPAAIPAELPLRSKSAPFRIGLFGAPRPGKGYERIRGIVSCIEDRLQSTLLDRPIEILLQGSEETYDEGGVYSFAREYKADEGPLRILKLSDRLDPSEFTNHFLSADAILLPYDTAVYGLQGSGIIQDAVAAEKVVIHSKGISMQAFLTHGNAISAVSDEEFASGIVKLVSTDASHGEARTAARMYYAECLSQAMPK